MNVSIENREKYIKDELISALLDDFEQAVNKEDTFHLALILNKLKNINIEIVIKRDETKGPFQ